ncbi:MAG: RDD family protein [Deltaproteobacteria bacterium]|jgi:uncharacterized RDD family membrane protein YckC|nr:RDD family protein [Deltaproteobacteria bacterium]
MATPNPKAGQRRPAVNRLNAKASQRARLSQMDRRLLVSPEGLPLVMNLAGINARISAFMIDLCLMGGFIVFFVVSIVFLFKLNSFILITLLEFGVFTISQLYFIYFELAWQGRTPGKKFLNLRVVNRKGGELTPGAIIARNLTREVEVFLPLALVLQNFFEFFSNSAPSVGALIWALTLSALPSFNKDRLRAGDLLAGTMVVTMPKRVLLSDISQDTLGVQDSEAFVFTPTQLSIYGRQELEVLENILRTVADLPVSKRNLYDDTLQIVCRKICAKIDYRDPIPTDKVRRFLSDFYKAERAQLERGLLFGYLKVNQSSKPFKGPSTSAAYKLTQPPIKEPPKS